MAPRVGEARTATAADRDPDAPDGTRNRDATMPLRAGAAGRQSRGAGVAAPAASNAKGREPFGNAAIVIRTSALVSAGPDG